MPKEKQFYIAYEKCLHYPKEESEKELEYFEYIWEYIAQEHFTTHYLELLLPVIPLGMLKFRLIQRLETVKNNLLTLPKGI